MMKRKRKDSKGVITVLVALLLVGVLSLGTVSIEAGRLSVAKTQAAEATLSAATSMIASYNSNLYEKYGLLAIDTARFTETRVIDYLDFNSDLSSAYPGNKVTRMYDIDSVELEGMYNLTYPAIMKRQLLSRAKYSIVPQDCTLNVYTSAAFFSDFQAKCQNVVDNLSPVINGTASAGSLDNVSAEMQAALAILYQTYKDVKTNDSSCNVTLTSSSVNMLPSKTGTVESNVLTDDIDIINATTSDVVSVLGGEGAILGSTSVPLSDIVDVSVDVSSVSGMKNKMKDVTSVTNLASETKNIARQTKTIAQSFVSAINALSGDKDGNLLLNSYIAEYFSNRNNRLSSYSAPDKGTAVSGKENSTFASACVEYVFGESASELTNQDVAYNYIFAVRFINNLSAVISESTSFDKNNTYSVAAHIAWALYESYVDMELLATYDVNVPFNKNAMILSVNNPSSVVSAFASKKTPDALTALGYYNGEEFSVPGSSSFSYKDSLSFALWFVPNSDKMFRIADLIQLEMRYYEQYVKKTSASFLMSEQNTYCRINSVSNFNSLLPIVSLSSDGTGTGDVVFQSIKYAGY